MIQNKPDIPQRINSGLFIFWLQILYSNVSQQRCIYFNYDLDKYFELEEVILVVITTLDYFSYPMKYRFFI